MIRCQSRAALFSVITILLTCLLWGCAEVAAPPGGEVDKTGPYLLGSEPPNGAVNVEPGNTITLFFSEHIVEPATYQALFISPYQEDEPKIKWKSNRVIMTLPDSFQVDQTYIISLTSNIRDLRGNSLDSTASIAFTTGSVLDSGHIAGQVFSGDKPQGGVLIALYDAASLEDSTTYDSLYPAYMAQSNSSGRFRFDYLPDEEYRLIAFQDKNKNRLFNATREMFAVPDRPIVVGGEIFLNELNLSLTTQDSSRPEIISVRYTPDRLLKVRLSGAIDLRFLSENLPTARLVSETDSAITHPAAGLQEAVQQPTSVLNLYYPNVADGTYRLEMQYASDQPVLPYDSVIIVAAEDKVEPEMLSFTPDATPRFVRDIEIMAHFSEPLDTTRLTETTFELWQDTTSTVKMTRRWLDPFRLRFETTELKPGQSYQFKMIEFDVVDLAGNLLGDSLTVYSFRTLNADSLGSVAGKVSIDLVDRESDPVLLTLREYGTQYVYTLPVEAGEFSIDVPAGKYALSCYVDSDGNGKRTLGSIFPFQLSETFAAHPDTIRVRTRFETSGIELRIK